MFHRNYSDVTSYSSTLCVDCVFLSYPRLSVNWCPWLIPSITPRLQLNRYAKVLHQHIGWHSIKILAENLLIFDQYISVGWQLANYRPTVDQASIERRLSIDWDVDGGYQSRVLIDTWLWMTLEHMILVCFGKSGTICN